MISKVKLSELESIAFLEMVADLSTRSMPGKMFDFRRIVRVANRIARTRGYRDWPDAFDTNGYVKDALK